MRPQLSTMQFTSVQSTVEYASLGAASEESVMPVPGSVPTTRSLPVTPHPSQ